MARIAGGLRSTAIDNFNCLLFPRTLRLLRAFQIRVNQRGNRYFVNVDARRGTRGKLFLLLFLRVSRRKQSSKIESLLFED